MQGVVAAKTDFGAAGKAGLQQERAGVRARRLVQLDLHVGADVAEQHRRRRHRQAVHIVRRRADAETGEIFKFPQGEAGVAPRQTVALHDENALVLDVEDPAGLSRQHAPRARFEAHDRSGGLAVPVGPRRVGGQDVDGAVGGRGRFSRRGAAFDGRLHQPVEQGQRLVHGHMLLGLRSGQIGQR